MVRRALLSFVLLVSGAAVGTAPPAAAVSMCTGTGQATLSAGLSYFPTVSSNVGFTFTFNCATGGSVTGFGTLVTASCGRSTGSGTVPGVGSFAIETAGSMLVLTSTVTGAVVGGGNATPIPDTSTVPFGNSCSNGTAKVFTLEGYICADADPPGLVACVWY